LVLNPSYTEAEEGLAELYTAIGWFEEAMDHTKHILQLDPLSPNHHFTKANIHYIREEYLSAYQALEKALSINPAFTHAVELKQLCLIMLRREQELETYLNQTPEAEAPESCRLLYKISNGSGKVDITQIDDLVQSEPFSLMPWPLLMYVQNGNHTKALDILEDAVSNRRGQYANFLTRPFIKPLQSSERFQNLASATFDLKLLPDRTNGNDNTDRESPLKSKDEKTLMPPDEVSEFVEKLYMLMNDEQRFLDASLSLRTLAEETGLHPNKLSWLLNDQVGLSFNDYVNTYRLECFKEKAQNPDNQSFTLLGLAFDSGFNSKSTFNTFFKKRTGMTPRSWLKQQRK
jgi:AraC-like DNA-binding protein